MSAIDNALARDGQGNIIEEIVWRGRRHPFELARETADMVVFGLLFIAWAVAAWQVTGNTRLLLVSLAGLWWVKEWGLELIRYFNEEYCVTRKRFIKSYLIVERWERTVIDCLINKINVKKVVTDPWGSIIGYQRVQVETASKDLDISGSRLTPGLIAAIDRVLNESSRE